MRTSRQAHPLRNYRGSQSKDREVGLQTNIRSHPEPLLIRVRTTIAFSHRPKASWLPLLQEEREPADDILAYVRLISDRLLREEADISLQLTLLSSIELPTVRLFCCTDTHGTTVILDIFPIVVEPLRFGFRTTDPVEE